MLIWLALAVLLASSFVGPVTAAVASLDGPRAPTSPELAPLLASSDSAGGSVASAVKSLADGEGPAAGDRVDCRVDSGGASGICSPSSVDPSAGLSGGTASSTAPPAAYGAVMAYDAADGYVVLFGGSANGGTWTFHDGTWTALDLPVSASPSERTASSMVYDPADGEIVLFGGSHSGSSVSTTTYFNDTWAFRAGTWTNLTHPSDAPPRRYGAMMAYDAADGYVMMFGGNYQRAFYNDTWGFAAGAWTNLSAETPAADTPSCRFGSSGAYDAASGYVLMFGGVGKRSGQGCGMSALNSSAEGTWAFQGGSWRSLTPSTAPPARWDASMSYDSADGAVVLFGGLGAGDVALDDTWEFSGGNWTELSPVLYPVSRFSGAMTYDGADGYVLLYGGLSEPEPQAPLLSDVWSFSNGTWFNLTPIPCPPASPDLSLSYDAQDGYVLLFGSNPAGSAAETWRFVGGTWLELRPADSPPPFRGASMTYDASDGTVLLFGGLDGSTLSGDTWSFARGDWKNITTRSIVDPPGRYDAGMVYDPAAGEVVLFGGLAASGYLADTWAFAFGNWTEIFPTASPPARGAMSFAYDPSTGSVVMFGGESAGGMLQDTWEFSSGSWAELSLSLAPVPREGAALVDDAADGYLLLFGGLGSSGYLNDTWAFDGGSWTDILPSDSPQSRSSTGLAFDAPDGKVTLFGGTTSAGSLNDTWEYVAGAWSQLFPSHPPPPLAEFSIRFKERGLPSGSGWWVNVTTGPSLFSTSSTILFSEPNGSYAFQVASVNKSFSSEAGKFRVKGSNVARAVVFTPVTSALPLRESRCPACEVGPIELTSGPAISPTTLAVGSRPPSGTPPDRRDSPALADLRRGASRDRD